MAAQSLKLVDSKTSAPPRAQVRRSRTRSVKRAAGKSERDLLVALRDRIAGEIDGGVAARDLASLSKRLLEITREISALDAALEAAAAGEQEAQADEAAEQGDDVGEAAATPDAPWAG